MSASPEKKFGLLRNILRAFGLSQEAVDDIVNWIVDLLAAEGKSTAAQRPDFPYHLRDNFLSPAELNFFEALRTAVGNRAALCSKVSLGDLFYVKKDDPSRYRIYTNKIDRKHVDFLVCDAATLRPLFGIELDDKSHQRADRRARDEFVDQVFAAAGLPLLHIPARRTYVVEELVLQLSPYLSLKTPLPQTDTPKPTTKPQVTLAVVEPVSQAKANDDPLCPKCGGVMILRTAKSGANAGNKFWGCSNYPTCRSIVPYNA
jgi:hypothetical protein